MEKNTFTKKIKKFFYQKAQIILKKLIKINEFLKKIETILVLVGLFLAYYAFKDTREQLAVQKTEIKESQKRHSQQFRLQKEESRESSISRAWEIIGRKSLGNSGKIEALETLARYKDPKTGKPIPLARIDMSTKTHGGKWDELPKTKIGESEFVKRRYVKQSVYLQGLDLSKKTLSHKVNLYNADFSGANLIGANFEGADLLGAKFEGAILHAANFEDANLGWAKFEGADFVRAKFEGADLAWTNFEGTKLWEVKFEGANLHEANFEDANLIRAKFEGAKNIKNANFGKYNILFAFGRNSFLDGYLPSFSRKDKVIIKILLKDKDENNSNSWEDFDEKISENDGYQRFNRTKSKDGKHELIKDKHELIKDDKGYYFKIKILNNDKVKKAFEAGRKSKKVNNK